MNLNLKTIVTRAVEAEIDKVFKVTSASDQAVVNAAVEANTNLALLAMQRAFLTELATKHPEVGTVLKAVGLMAA